MLRTNATWTGLALTRDFREWIRLGPITHGLDDNRDVILFPEKVGGKFVLLHRPTNLFGPEYDLEHPAMWISFSDDLLNWKRGQVLAKGEFEWEGGKIGGNTPPIRTEHGWLTLYHAVGADGHYRLGAMLLDLENPAIVRYRTRDWLLQPEEWYELEGYYPGVCFPCGKVVIGDTLFVYYGGADKYVGLATCRAVGAAHLSVELSQPAEPLGEGKTMPLMFDMPRAQLATYGGTNPRPADFDAYWHAALAEMGATILDVELVPAEFQAPFAECFHLYYTGVRGARIHAQYLRPKGQSTLGPAVLMFHGYAGDSGDWIDKLPYVSLGYTVAAMDCRGQGLSSDPGIRTNWSLGGHIVRGLDGPPDHLHYRQVFLDAAQLAGIVMTQPLVDQRRVVVFGGSQGGGLALACAALEPARPSMHCRPSFSV